MELTDTKVKSKGQRIYYAGKCILENISEQTRSMTQLSETTITMQTTA